MRTLKGEGGCWPPPEEGSADLWVTEEHSDEFDVLVFFCWQSRQQFVFALLFRFFKNKNKKKTRVAWTQVLLLRHASSTVAEEYVLLEALSMQLFSYCIDSIFSSL